MFIIFNHLVLFAFSYGLFISIHVFDTTKSIWFYELKNEKTWIKFMVYKWSVRALKSSCSLDGDIWIVKPCVSHPNRCHWIGQSAMPFYWIHYNGKRSVCFARDRQRTKRCARAHANTHNTTKRFCFFLSAFWSIWVFVVTLKRKTPRSFSQTIQQFQINA